MATIASTRIARLQAVSPRATGAIDQSGVVMSLSNAAVTLPASSLGVVSSYAGATTTASVMQGAVDSSSLWTFSKVDSAGVSSTLAGALLIVTSLSADSAQVTITAARVGYPSLSKIFSLSRAKDGANGTNGTNGTTPDVSNMLQKGTSIILQSGLEFKTSGYAAGSGVAITDNGILCKKSSIPQFTLDSAGNAAFAGAITGGTININSGAFQVSGAGVVTASYPVFSAGTFSNTANPGLPCITATTFSGSNAPAIKATANSGQNAVEAIGHAYVSGNLTVGGSLSVSGSLSGLSKSSIGLGNVDNTADATKSVNAASSWGSAAFQSAGSGWWSSQNPKGFIRTNYGLIPYYPG